MRSFFRRLVWRLARKRKEAELADELRFHIDEEAADREDAGESAEEARRRARLDFGNPVAVEEDTRAA